MILLFKYRWNRIVVRTATLYFVLGTLLMLSALMANNDTIINLSIALIVTYIPITLIMFIILFINTIINFKDIHEHVMALAIVLINIFIAVLHSCFLNI